METDYKEAYNVVVGMIKKHGTEYYKKHGKTFALQLDGQYIALDTYNGYINLIEGEYTPYKCGVHTCIPTTFDQGEQIARYIDSSRFWTTPEKIGRAYKLILKALTPTKTDKQ